MTLQNAAGKISPLKEHAAVIADPQLKVFASQAPQALTWYHGKNAPQAEKALTEMIEAVVAGDSTLETALATAAQQVTKTLR